MLQPAFPLFSSGITASVFASPNVPREDRFRYTLEEDDFSLVTLGKEGVLYPGDTSLLVLYYQISSPI